MNGTPDVVIAKYNNAGSVDWANRATGGGANSGQDIVLDDSDEYPIIVGQTNGGNFGPDPGGNSVPAATLSSDVFMARYDANSGQIIWLETAGGVTVDNGLGIATNASRDLFITGTYQSTATFGTISTGPATGALDIFVAKFNSPVFENAFAGFRDLDVGDARFGDLDNDRLLDVVTMGRDQSGSLHFEIHQSG